MPSYYEMLKVQPTASVTEIETACETQYNQWRRLVTHHDPNVVNQANQALQTLETIRTTLTDPSKRSIYDTAIGLNSTGAVGGLMDPSVVLQGQTMGGQYMTPPAPSRASVPTPNAQAQAGTSGLWVCPSCKSENPAETFHCFRCGTQLVRQCPECHNMTSLVATGFCGTCGYKYETAARRAELKSQMDKVRLEMTSLGHSTIGGGNGTLWLLWGFGIIVVFWSLSSLQIILGAAGLLGLVYAVWQYRSGGSSFKELPSLFTDAAKSKAINARIGNHPKAVPVWVWIVALLMFVLGLLLDRSYGGGFVYNEGVVTRFVYIVISTLGAISLVVAFTRTRDARSRRDAESVVHTQALDQKRNELRALEQEYQTLEMRRTG